MKYVYLCGSVFFAVYCQVVLKWRLHILGGLPDQLGKSFHYFLRLSFDPYMITCYLAAVGAFLTWVAALSKWQLSYVYPLFISFSFVLILIFDMILFQTVVTPAQAVGLLLIITGISLIGLAA